MSSEFYSRGVIGVRVEVDYLVFLQRVKKLLREKGKTVGELAKYLSYFGGEEKLQKVLDSDRKVFDILDEKMLERRRCVMALAGQANLIANFLDVDVLDLIAPSAKTSHKPEGTGFQVDHNPAFDLE